MVAKKADDIIKEFQDMAKDVHSRLRELKGRIGKPMIGYLCSYTPLEIMTAAGIIPVRLLSTSEHIQEAGAHLPHFACHFARSILDLGLRGVTDYLDGMVACRTCDVTFTCFDVWEKQIPSAYTHFIQVPTLVKDEGVEDFFLSELDLFKKSLEKYIGRQITDEDLRNAVGLYNRNRRLIRQIYQMRKEEKVVISGTEMTYILLAGVSMPVDEHNKLLEELLAVLPERASVAGKDKVRVMILSAAIDYHNVEIIQEIERSGGIVVMDSSCVGSRIKLDDVQENGNPLGAIGKRYLDRVPCPTKCPVEPWFQNVLALAEEYKVQGVIFVIEKFCDAHMLTHPPLRDAFKAKNIPSIKIDLGEGVSPLAQIKTRAGAFYEMIKKI